MKKIINRILVSIILIALLVSCTHDPEDKKSKIAVGEKRHELFVECMELAAKIERNSDDDVSDIISACGTQSYYIANQMTGE